MAHLNKDNYYKYKTTSRSKLKKSEGWNPNLEADIQKYILTHDSDLFEKKIYLPLCYMAYWLIDRRRVDSYIYNIEEFVEDCVLKVLQYLPLWKPNMGMTAVSWCHLSIRHQISNHINTTIKVEQKHLPLDIPSTDEDESDAHVLDLNDVDGWVCENTNQERRDKADLLRGIFLRFWKKYLDYYFPGDVVSQVNKRTIIKAYLDYIENPETLTEFRVVKDIYRIIAKRFNIKTTYVTYVIRHFKNKNRAIKYYFDKLVKDADKIVMAHNGPRIDEK